MGMLFEFFFIMDIVVREWIFFKGFFVFEDWRRNVGVNSSRRDALDFFVCFYLKRINFLKL